MPERPCVFGCGRPAARDVATPAGPVPVCGRHLGRYALAEELERQRREGVTMGEPTWTADRPAAGGWYWAVASGHGATPQVVEVTLEAGDGSPADRVDRAGFDGPVPRSDFVLWCGPLAHPPPPEDANG